MKKHYEFATYYRVLGVIFILLCHFVQQNENSYLKMSAQFFNIGVSMFFILSGFLFGIRDGEENAALWYIKRIKRIYVPYELFIVVLFIIHCCLRFNVKKIDWLFLVLGLQGSVVGVLGAEHTWFISALLLCYLITPMFKYIFRSGKYSKIIVFVIFLTPLALCAVPCDFVFTLFSLICWYATAYFIGTKANKIKLSAGIAGCTFILMCMSFGVRIIARVLIDGTNIYNRGVVGYTQIIGAFCLFYIVMCLTRNKRAGKTISFISAISFEIYLCHYMFTVGPLKVFGLTDIWLLDSIVVIVLTVCVAFIINLISKYILNKISNRGLN